ncbi:putative 8-amino-7-oxononanoate synthase [Golovinomyces cichoracearum]|uniref:Putative 8-amino-7-oxononanoate synthase n=1 Tax=Golovinomyces cichoracearum TaxID=62708 RepID=A0A420IHZ2_9PEZI|nr:putative 8-amino-7-oxononanoate synthase [Golovinomyces cichoracearum]
MATPALMQSMITALENRRNNSVLRCLHETPANSLDFSSNDFLSLSTSSLLRRNYLNALANTAPSDFRVGSGGSRLLDGNHPLANQLESKIAQFHGAKSALLFNSGFGANMGFFACIPQKGDVVLHDALIHASVCEGLKLSRAGRVCSFSHNSITDLKNKISDLIKYEPGLLNGTKNIFVAVEALYSMDGDLAPLCEIVELMEQSFTKGNVYLVVDEAHSNGLYGEMGSGLVCKLGLENKVFARLHTFGKALACNGAALLCDSLVREYLINYAKPLIYTTSMSFPSLVAINTVYTLMKQGATQLLISHLKDLISHFFNQLITLFPLTTNVHTKKPILILPLEAPQSPIFSLITSEPRSLAAHCYAAGFIVRPIMPPTVPKGTQRVRICLHAGNTFKEIDNLVQCVTIWLQKERMNKSAVSTCEHHLAKAIL